MAVDFEIDVIASQERDYQVTARSPSGGEATAAMRLTPEILALVVRVPEAVIASSAPVRSVVSAWERPVRELGSLLFRALFAEDIHSLLMESRQQAALSGEQLRIVLRTVPGELARLPWEFLFDPGQNDYMCLSTPLIRRPQLLRPVRALDVTGPLRVLGMVATPGDQPELAADDELGRLASVMNALEGRVELAWVDGQSWRDLNVALRRGGPWHVLHFIGHGGFDSSAQEGVLVLADENGRSHLLSASDLALLVEKHQSVRLVVLNACDTARASAQDASSSVAGALLRRGVPSVLAMQFPITDPAAIEFSRTFYEALADRLPVDTAVTEARHALRITLPRSLEWGTPVLYLRSADGTIFAPEAQQGSRTPRQEPEAEPIVGDELARLYAEGPADFAAPSAAEAETERETQAQAFQLRRPKIFLCYRREDTQGFARGIYECLAGKYGHEQVFRDIDSTPAGVRYSTWIESRVGQCSVMIVLIGDAWLSAKDLSGRRRLDLPKDWVRHEIEAALRRDIPIIPVRLQGASMPSEDELPASIADLTGFQSAEITDSRWVYDVGLLTQAIDNLITQAGPYTEDDLHR